MGTFAEVKFKGTRKEYFTAEDPSLQVGTFVVVEADRGEDLGELRALGEVAERKCSTSGGCGTPTPTRKVLRVAEPNDLGALESLRQDEHRVRTETRAQARKLGLRMKITEAEWQFDRKKLTIYFTADHRVDFRQLVRQLARTFHTRIELRQIGVREEAALLGGVGRCGRELCCSSWLPELKPVSLNLAKDQRLSLNPTQISGCCGRLMCCLLYEHQAYAEARRRFPREGKTLRTAKGEEKVLSVDIWKETVTLRSDEGERRVLALASLQEEIAVHARAPRGDSAGA